MKKYTHKEIQEWIRTIEDYKWRKTYNVDAKRITYFVNNGLEANLPTSLARKNDSYSYSRSKRLAKQFLEVQEAKLKEETKLRMCIRVLLKEVLKK